MGALERAIVGRPEARRYAQKGGLPSQSELYSEGGGDIELRVYTSRRYCPMVMR